MAFGTNGTSTTQKNVFEVYVYLYIWFIASKVDIFLNQILIYGIKTASNPENKLTLKSH